MDNLSPIVLFVYNRPIHTQKTIDALMKNKGISMSRLFIFSDAPKKTEDIAKVNQVRDIIKNIKSAFSVEIVENKINKGLAESIIEGVTQIVKEYGKVIVLEDDLVTSPYFITYMNEALSLYQTDEKVMHISAFVPPLKNKLPSTFFYNQASCWGWGTWDRAWQLFINDALTLKNRIIETGHVDKFNIDNAHNFMSQLQDNIDKKINTWAIKWQAVVFLNNGLCLHPNKSLVQNIGLDWSGEHTGPMPYYFHKTLADSINLKKIELIESTEARSKIVKFLKNNNSTERSFFKKLKKLFHLTI